MSDGRLVAARCLIETSGGGFSNLVFKKLAGRCEDARERRFASALFYGTLERKLTLDFILAKYVSSGIKKLDAEVLAALEIGLYQCLFMDSVRTDTAVDESVKLCARLKKTSARGLVNAVLRRAAAFELGELDDIKDGTQRLSVKYSMCAPLVETLKAQYGDKAEPMMAAMFGPPRTFARVNTLKCGVETAMELLRNEGVEAKPTRLEGAIEIVSGDYLASEALKSGAIRIQSLAAQTAVHALAPKPNQRVLDMCAAPGGKTLTAAQLMDNSGAITALDIHDSRLELITARAKLEGIDIVSAEKADAREYSDEPFDRVLCDVPCSGYGEIAGKPELRYKSPADSAGLPDIQLAILEKGASLLKEGGRLVYSTCTLDKRENDGVAAEFLKRHSDFMLVDTACADEKPGETGVIRFIPSDDGGEGFYVATLERI